jgi:hypothetical protein
LDLWYRKPLDQSPMSVRSDFSFLLVNSNKNVDFFPRIGWLVYAT